MKIFALFCLLPLATFAQSRPPSAASTHDGHRSLSERLLPIFAGIGDSRTPGVALLVLDHGKIKFMLPRGVENIETRKPITQQTNFRLASCTKQFTAMAIMLLVHDGKLKFDDTLTSVFPEFPAYGKNITIRNLLNHASGLPDYEDLMELPAYKTNGWSRTHQISDAEVLKLLESASSGKFAPGTQWSYSNSGYVMLGNIVAKVSGMSFPQFLHDRIFAALGMEHTVAHIEGKDQIANRALGYSLSRAPGPPDSMKERSGAQADPHFIDTDQSSTSATLGDGGIYSNLEDLAKWDASLAAHTLLSEEEMSPALAPFKMPNSESPKWSGDSGDEDPQHGRPVKYGFGWFVDPLPNAPHSGDSLPRSSLAGHPRMWHYGDTSGFKSAIMRFPDDGLTIIILTNRTDVDPAKLAERVAEVY